MPELKILLGGLPLGCDNIGDEAVLVCFTGILRRLVPFARITVCTAEQKETAAVLGVETAPLFGFRREHPIGAFSRLVRDFDCFIWCGATGLSDYPQIGVSLLEAARKQKVATIVWGVGMDSEFDPSLFRVHGPARPLLRAAELLSFGRLPAVARCEEAMRKSMRKRIGSALKHCKLVVVRDFETAEELRNCGFDAAVTGADSAILQRTGTVPLVAKDHYRIGFCVSARRSIVQRGELIALWNWLTSNEAFELVLIPMNSETDSVLMKGLVAEMEHPERARIVEAHRPAEVQGIAASCNVVISSRLYLLILAANAGIPVIGIERGSKIRNFLGAFGLTPAGTVENCDFGAIGRAVEAYLSDSGESFRRRAAKTRTEMLCRLEAAEQTLEKTLSSLERK